VCIIVLDLLEKEKAARPRPPLFRRCRCLSISVDMEVQPYVPDGVGAATHSFSNLTGLELTDCYIANHLML